MKFWAQCLEKQRCCFEKVSSLKKWIVCHQQTACLPACLNWEQLQLHRGEITHHHAAAHFYIDGPWNKRQHCVTNQGTKLPLPWQWWWGKLDYVDCGPKIIFRRRMDFFLSSHRLSTSVCATPTLSVRLFLWLSFLYSLIGFFPQSVLIKPVPPQAAQLIL